MAKTTNTASKAFASAIQTYSKDLATTLRATQKELATIVKQAKAQLTKAQRTESTAQTKLNSAEAKQTKAAASTTKAGKKSLKRAQTDATKAKSLLETACETAKTYQEFCAQAIASEKKFAELQNELAQFERTWAGKEANVIRAAMNECKAKVQVQVERKTTTTTTSVANKTQQPTRQQTTRPTLTTSPFALSDEGSSS